jgi:Fe-S-cluster-containing dehydrogenase component
MSFGRRTLLKGLAVVGAASAVPAAAEASSERKYHRKPDDVGMLYDTTLCVGCRACVTKCKEANELPYDKVEMNGAIYDAPDRLNGTTKNVIQVADVGEGKWAFMKAQCMHCVDPACVSVCMAHALHKSAGGVVAYKPATCVGCRYCQVGCPFDVPKFEWTKALPLIVKCELCRHRAKPEATGALSVANPACCEVCPREAVIYGTVADLQAVAKKRMETHPEKYNPDVYGLDDGGGTQVMYMTAKGIEFGKLGLPDLGHEPLPATAEKVGHTVYKWFAAPTLLYGFLAYTIYKNQKKEAGAAAHGHGKEK